MYLLPIIRVKGSAPEMLHDRAMRIERASALAREPKDIVFASTLDGRFDYASRRFAFSERNITER
jgi:hypothetical protein